MRQITRACVRAAALAAISVFGLRAAGAAEPSMSSMPATQPVNQQELLDEVRALRAEVKEMKAQQTAQAAAATQPPDQATVTALHQDAAFRTSHPFALSDGGDFQTGYINDRFTIQSTDGNFVFRPWMHFQFRETTLGRQDFKNNSGSDDNTSNGFEMRRMRLGFDGNMFTPDLTYFFNWATVRANGTSAVTDANGNRIGTTSNNLGGSLLLEEAWLKYRLNSSDFYVIGGQIKDPVLHDQMVSSRYQQAEERSLTADIFMNGDAFTQGALLIYDPKNFIRISGGINHGLRSANTNFLDYPNSNAFNYGVVGRVEYKVMGDWKDYNLSAVGVKKDVLVFGLGTDYSERGHAGQTVTALDGTYISASGLSIYGALLDRYTNHQFGIATQSATGASLGTPDPAVANDATNEYSVVAQAGYVFNDRIEPFGRFEYMKLQGTVAGSDNYVPVYSLGVNYYFYGHKLKLTGEGSYLPEGIPIDDTPNDILTSNGKGEFLVDFQLQLLI